MDIKAVLFDFDGVIAETEPLHHASFCAVVEGDGLACDWSEYVQHYIGFDDRDLFRCAYRSIGRELDENGIRELVQRKAEAFVHLASTGVRPYPGIPELLHDIARRYPVGLCSGALRSDIDPIVAQLAIDSVFRIQVTAEDVPASKPDPACYRLAAERLGATMKDDLPYHACVAVEDTPTGVTAALDAGLRVWAVTHTHRAEELQQAHRVAASLHELLRPLMED